MTEKFELYGPFDVEVKVYLTDGDQVATATYAHGRSKFFGPEDMAGVIEKVVTQLNDQMDGEWRACTKREYFDQLMRDMTGSSERFALPGGDDWDVID